MSTTAFSSDGSKLQVSISSVYTEVKGVVGMKVPAIKPAYDDISNLGSPSGFPERIAIGKDFTDVPIQLIYDPSDPGQAALETAAGAQTLQAFKILCSNSVSTPKTFAFSGYVTWEPDLAARKAARSQLTINVTGAITITN